MVSKDTRSRYGRTEFIFNEVAKTTGRVAGDISVIKKILEGRDLHDRSVLEVGCGLGDNLLYCVREGARYAEGFDISSGSLMLAKMKSEGMLNVFFHKCNIESYFTDKKFDLIMAIGVFEYFDDPIAALDKICSLAASGGTVVLLVSKPIFIKKISFLCRAFLSRIPRGMVLKAADMLDGIFRIFTNKLSTSTSRTYTMKRVILEGLMVGRYNIIDKNLLCDCFKKASFNVSIRDDISPSMTCLIAERKD